MKRNIYFLLIVLLATGFTAESTSAQPFEITQSNISNSGGGASSDGLLQVHGAVGQPVATTNGSMGGLLNLRAGFFTPAPFAPTAASAEIVGRVVNARNRPIKHARLMLVGGTLVEPKVSYTNPFGYFKFTGVEVGHFYFLSVSHRRHQFGEDTISFTLQENLRGLVFASDSKF